MWIGDEVRGRSWLGYDEAGWGGGYRYCGILTPTVGQGPLHSRGHIRCHLISIPSTTFLSVTVILRSSSCLLLRFLCLLAPDQLSLVSTTATALCSHPFLRWTLLLTILCPSLRIFSFLSSSSDHSKNREPSMMRETHNLRPKTLRSRWHVVAIRRQYKTYELKRRLLNC